MTHDTHGRFPTPDRTYTVTMRVRDHAQRADDTWLANTTTTPDALTPLAGTAYTRNQSLPDGTLTLDRVLPTAHFTDPTPDNPYLDVTPDGNSTLTLTAHDTTPTTTTTPVTTLPTGLRSVETWAYQRDTQNGADLTNLSAVQEATCVPPMRIPLAQTTNCSQTYQPLIAINGLTDNLYAEIYDLAYNHTSITTIALLTRTTNTGGGGGVCKIPPPGSPKKPSKEYYNSMYPYLELTSPSGNFTALDPSGFTTNPPILSFSHTDMRIQCEANGRKPVWHGSLGIATQNQPPATSWTLTALGNGQVPILDGDIVDTQRINNNNGITTHEARRLQVTLGSTLYNGYLQAELTQPNTTSATGTATFKLWVAAQSATVNGDTTQGPQPNQTNTPPTYTWTTPNVTLKCMDPGNSCADIPNELP